MRMCIVCLRHCPPCYTTPTRVEAHMPPQKHACVCVFVGRDKVLSAQTGAGVLMGWLQLVGSLKFQVFLQKSPILQRIWRSLLIVGTWAMQTTAHKEQRKARAGLLFANLPGYFTFNFFGCCDAATQLALQIQQERTQVVCGFGFWVVMPQHSQHSNYSYKWCEVRRQPTVREKHKIHQKVCRIFSSTLLTLFSKDIGGTHPPPPIPFEKTVFSDFGFTIQIYDAKIQIYNAKIQLYAPKLKFVTPKFKQSTPHAKK